MRRAGVPTATDIAYSDLLVGIPLSWLGLHYTGVHAAPARIPVPVMPRERLFFFGPRISRS